MRTAALQLLQTSFFLLALGAGSCVPGQEPEPVRIVGSSGISKPVSLAVPVLTERGVLSRLELGAGSKSCIAAVGEGAADVAISVRPLTGEDRAPYPHTVMEETLIGYQALAFVVPREVWRSGVHSLSKDQIRAIYEGKIANWKELGGGDQPIKFLNPEQGAGVWEFFVTWLYGDIRKAPLGETFETVNGGRQTRDIVEFNVGSLGLVSPLLADNKRIFALAMKEGSGEPVLAELKNIYEKRYPIVRPYFLVTREHPSGGIRKVLDFMLSAEGQDAMKKSEFIPLETP